MGAHERAAGLNGGNTGMAASLMQAATYTYMKTIRQILPRSGYKYLNGVPVPPEIAERKLFDRLLGINPDIPTYEDGIVRCQELIRKGDDITIIGGGTGITTVTAAKKTGGGTVTVYDGAQGQVERIMSVLELNSVDGCEVIPAVVGEPRDVYGEGTPSETASPTSLDETDVLQMDCEGSELDILREFSISPRLIIMELHPFNWTPEYNAAIEFLHKHGYRIVRRFGHDGVPVDKEQFDELLQNSARQGPRFIESGARYPAVLAAERAENDSREH